MEHGLLEYQWWAHKAQVEVDLLDLPAQPVHQDRMQL
jgi:hypothetical protein